MHTIDKWKMVFGFVLLVFLGSMGLTFAHGKVEERTSFGLMPVLTTLSTLAGAFASWAFTPKKRDEEGGTDGKDSGNGQRGDPAASAVEPEAALGGSRNQRSGAGDR